ncbi:AAA family ATPase [Bradyrhizobium sp. HKCCYLRH1030]|uniref:AAA family ATPase n=1 Tax=Bradyrhizobium sp. HKCCYLRH1030 TaxID=3420744 RepID=UPI003EBCC41D
MKHDSGIAAPIRDAQKALSIAARTVATAPPTISERLQALRKMADELRQYVEGGCLSRAAVVDKIFEVAESNGLIGQPGGDREAAVMQIAMSANLPREPYGGAQVDDGPPVRPAPSPPSLETKTPAAWKGTEPLAQRWLAAARIPCGDLTLYSGNGGAGKTETAAQLLVSVAAGLGDWLGCVVETGPALFLSCEEPEANVRDRIERICRHRHIDPHAIDDLHLHFPDLDSTWLVTADRLGKLTRTALFLQIEAWICEHRPILVVIDSIAAVFDGEAIARRQVRSFLAMLRKIARENETAIVMLDHPSVRGMADGSGTANSVDWRNSVRAMMHLSDADKNDPDVRELEVKKSNYGRAGEKIRLRWNGLTFVPATSAESSSYRAAAERSIDELFLKLLDKRIAQGRPVRPSSGRGSAPFELAGDPEANGVSAGALRAAMERLFTAGRIVSVETGPASKRRKHIERAPR